MIGVDKVQKDQLTSILQTLNLDNLNRSMLSQMMRVLDFQEDVAFAKSLFSQRIVYIYRQSQGQYQKFLAEDKISRLQYEAKCLLFAIFRLFGQEKLKQNLQKSRQNNNNSLSQLTLPDSSNINEVIKFQKTMYQCLKHLLPEKKEQTNPNYYYTSQHMNFNPLQSFAPYPIFSQKNARQSEYQSMRSVQDPITPGFRNPSSFPTHQVYQSQVKEPYFLTFKSEYNPEKDSMFAKLANVDVKKQPQSFLEFESFRNRSFLTDKSASKQQIPSLRGFTAFSFSESDLISKPVKKVKKDSFLPVYSAQNIKNVKQQLEAFSGTFKNDQQKQRHYKAQKELNAELEIKQSISEYFQDDKEQKNIKQEGKP